MPALRVKQNAVFRALDDYMIKENRLIDCRLKDGDYRPMIWGGFITSDDMMAKLGRKVKMLAHEYAKGDRFSGWTTIQPGQHVLGCIIGDRAYRLLQDEHVVIIPQTTGYSIERDFHESVGFCTSIFIATCNR